MYEMRNEILQYLILCRTLTFAQRSSKLLDKYGIVNSIVKAPQKLSGAGCGYAVSVSGKGETAVSILKQNNMISGKIFVKLNGEYKEIK